MVDLEEKVRLAITSLGESVSTSYLARRKLSCFTSGISIIPGRSTGKKTYFFERLDPAKETTQLTVRDTETGNRILKTNLISEIIAIDSQNEIAAFGSNVDLFTNEIEFWDLVINKEKPLKKKIITKMHPQENF